MLSLSIVLDTGHCVLHMQNLSVPHGFNAKVESGSIRFIVDSKLRDQEGSNPRCSSWKYRSTKNVSRGEQRVQKSQNERIQFRVGSIPKMFSLQSITDGGTVG